MRTAQSDRVGVLCNDRPPPRPSHFVELMKQPDGTFAISDRISFGKIIAALLRRLGVRR